MSRKFTLLAGASFLMFSTNAFAQDAASEAVAAEDDTSGLEEIVVTAQKREQNMQDVPVAVTALSGETLSNQRINDFADLTKAAPSLTVTQRASAADNSINIRGIGTFAFTTGVDPSVAVIVDDVALVQQAQAFSNLADVERIEVLRGPQGTLFGKNASAGAVNIVTKGPTSDFAGQVSAGYASDGEWRFNAGISGPLGDTVGYRLSGFYSNQNGYVRNLTTGQRINNDESKGLRAKLKFDLTDTFQIALSADWSKNVTRGNASTFLSVPAGSTFFGSVPVDLTGIIPGKSNFNVRLSDAPASTSKQHSLSARASLDLGFANLVSITSARNGITGLSKMLMALPFPRPTAASELYKAAPMPPSCSRRSCGWFRPVMVRCPISSVATMPTQRPTALSQARRVQALASSAPTGRPKQAKRASPVLPSLIMS